MFIHNIGPEIISYSFLSIRWYGLFFVGGFVLAFLFLKWLFKKEKKDSSHLESLALYMLLGLIIGARFGHVVFYNLEYFLKHPIEVFYIWEGGLASHGAAAGVLIAYLIWLRVYKIKFSVYADLLALGFPLMSMCVRIGNFFNSEIIGTFTREDWGVVFSRLGESEPRHPVQLYEVLQNLLIFIILFIIYKKYYRKLPRLFIFFLYVFLYFVTRFVVEFWKERHILPDSVPLSMGQILSIVPVIIAIGYFIYIINNKWKKNRKKK